MYVYIYMYIHYGTIITHILMYIIITTYIIVNNNNHTLTRSSQGHRFYKKAEGNLSLHSKD